MRQRIAHVSLAVLTAATWFATARPAWANAPDPSRYPEAYEAYGRNMSYLFYGVLGCMALIVVLVILGIVLLIRWIVRRKRLSDSVSEGTTAEAEADPTRTP